jgi:acyl-CoA reductase-like NAD-dependent aldehyde dehydrogenase
MAMNRKVKIPTAKGIVVNNKWHASNSGKEIPVSAPATGEVVGAIAAGNARDIDVAVEADRRASCQMYLSQKNDGQQVTQCH